MHFIVYQGLHSFTEPNNMLFIISNRRQINFYLSVNLERMTINEDDDSVTNFTISYIECE